MTQMWEQLPSNDLSNVTSYVDDILVTAALRAECLTRTTTVLEEIIERTGFKVNLAKAQRLSKVPGSISRPGREEPRHSESRID